MHGLIKSTSRQRLQTALPLAFAGIPRTRAIDAYAAARVLLLRCSINASASISKSRDIVGALRARHPGTTVTVRDTTVSGAVRCLSSASVVGVTETLVVNTGAAGHNEILQRRGRAGVALALFAAQAVETAAGEEGA